MNDGQIAALHEQIEIMHQALIEVSHAQHNGPGWYTRGESGMYQQVSMWVQRGHDAVHKMNEILGAHDD